ncbi:hypothetical protein THAOC_13637 [Thalassiosira oceanica]|uniref:Uncharacterized protein n=1 Tax=Thalassiosira oceanica TaxID=159749 RepID=K0T504_THAOC|nr:hypothetical protein THAOC_13637 [Thalassiosira oceanica]|eukprot:EJK65492.1 hypothetical protein THAOC_13637 [Thalassiosira oceanica]
MFILHVVLSESLIAKNKVDDFSFLPPTATRTWSTRNSPKPCLPLTWEERIHQNMEGFEFANSLSFELSPFLVLLGEMKSFATSGYGTPSIAKNQRREERVLSSKAPCWTADVTRLSTWDLNLQEACPKST